MTDSSDSFKKITIKDFPFLLFSNVGLCSALEEMCGYVCYINL